MKVLNRLLKLATALMIFFAISPLQAQNQQDGRTALEKHQYEKAKKIFNTLIQKEPGNASHYYYMGNIYVENEMTDSAKYFYDKGLQANANEALNYVGEGKVLLMQKKSAEARAQFDKALEMTKRKNAFVMEEIAEAFYQALSLPDADYAFNLVNEAAKMDDKNPYYHIVMGDAWRLKGEGGKGMSEYEKAASINAKYALAQLRIGEFYSKVKSWDPAKEAFDKVIAIDSTYSPVYKALGEFYFNRGQVTQAIESYKKYLNQVGRSPQERLRYASFLFINKDYKNALAEMQAIKDNDPKNLVMLRLLGYSSFETGDYQNGLQYMEKYFSLIKPEDELAKDFEYYGKLLSKNGQDSLAIINYRKSLSMDSSNTDLYDNIAESYYNKKDYVSAAQTLEQKIAKTKDKLNAQDYYKMGVYYYRGKDFKKADSAFVFVNQYYPDFEVGYLYRARANSNLDPESTQGLAKPYYETFIDKALLKADQYKAELIEAYSYLGYYNYKAKDYPKAKDYYNKVLALDPSNKSALEIMKYLKTKK